MKTKNNVQKASKKSVVFILSLVVMSLTIQAQNYGNSILAGNDFNENFLAMADKHSEISLKSSKMAMNLAYIPVESEEELNLEEWMTEESRFDAFQFSLQTESEEALEIEGWMLDENNFNHSTFQLLIETETETELELEAWMVDENVFKSKVETENKLELEAWMTSDEVWNR